MRQEGMTGEPKQRVLLWLDRLARWGLSLVFLAAAVPKLFDPDGFAKIIDAYGVLPRLLLYPAAIILPVVEIVLAAGLLGNHRLSKIGSAVLLLIFIVLLANASWHGLDIDCGCFGPEDPEFKAFHGVRGALFRDILLIIPLIYSCWYHRYWQIAKHSGR